MSENLVEKCATKTYIDGDYKDIVVNENQFVNLVNENEKLHKELDYADNYNIYLIAKLDKIKEYIKENACYDKNIKQCCRDLLTDECNYVLKLLEEIE